MVQAIAVLPICGNSSILIVVVAIVSLSSAPSHCHCHPPRATPDKAGPTRAVVGRWGEGRVGGELGIIGIVGQKGERMGAT